MVGKGRALSPGQLQEMGGRGRGQRQGGKEADLGERRQLRRGGQEAGEFVAPAGSWQVLPVSRWWQKVRMGPEFGTFGPEFGAFGPRFRKFGSPVEELEADWPEVVGLKNRGVGAREGRGVGAIVVGEGPKFQTKEFGWEKNTLKAKKTQHIDYRNDGWKPYFGSEKKHALETNEVRKSIYTKFIYEGLIFK